MTRLEFTIRESVPSHIPAIEVLYPQAFPDEDLVPLVQDLLQDPGVALSLVATIDSGIAGHAIFTRCSVSDCKAALLGPLAVAPAWQRRGIGTALVRDGLQRMRAEHARLVCVLGDPLYYGRLGFEPDALVLPPYPLPAEWQDAWQSQRLDDSATPCAGRLSVPAPWLQPELWRP